MGYFLRLKMPLLPRISVRDPTLRFWIFQKKNFFQINFIFTFFVTTSSETSFKIVKRENFSFSMTFFGQIRPNNHHQFGNATLKSNFRNKFVIRHRQEKSDTCLLTQYKVLSEITKVFEIPASYRSVTGNVGYAIAGCNTEPTNFCVIWSLLTFALFGASNLVFYRYFWRNLSPNAILHMFREL